MNRRAPLLVAAVLAASCLPDAPAPEGIAPASPTGGPRITWDLDAEPLPEIPFPNDLATRLDPTSPTGRRVNISLEAPTKFERELRQKASRLTGFASFSPVTVGFDSPIDLCNLAARHHGNDDFTDDVAYIVNVQEGPRFGEVIPLDMGRGFFPTLLEKRRYFRGDPGTGTNLLLADVAEYPPAACADAFEYDRNTVYEHATNTLLLQPMYPLEQKATHAVVLTRRLVGPEGKPIESPFPWVNHVRQTAHLARLPDAFATAHTPDGNAVSLGTQLADIAFAWTFTTQDASGELLDIRRGLYGHGPYAYLEQRYPVNADTARLRELARDSALPGELRTILPMDGIIDTLGEILAPLLEGTADVGPLLETLRAVDYIVSGEMVGPDFLADRDGIAQPDVGCEGARGAGWDCQRGIAGDDDESFEIDPRTGEHFQAPHDVPFWCLVPKAQYKQEAGKPFPVIVYSHGYSSARIEVLAFSGILAQYGFASCVVAAFAHGVGLEDPLPDLVWSLLDESDIATLWEDLSPDRARDLNNDGVPDVGGDFFTSDAFHTRDVVRQTVVDHLTVIRMLRSFDGRRGADVDGDGEGERLGDFDADGTIDIGGPDADYFAWGTSMGGLHSSIIAAVEPAIVAAAPNAGAAGLFDVAVRSSLGAVIEAVWLPLMGPIFYGETGADGKTQILTIVSDVNTEAEIPLGVREGLEPGDGIRVENLANGEVGETVVRPDGVFRVSVAADASTPWEKRHEMGFSVYDVQAESYGTVPPPVVADPTRFGDPVRVVMCVGPCQVEGGEVKNVRATLERFEAETHTGAGGTPGVLFQGTVYRSGAPLAALAEGFGNERQTPDLRRLRIIAGFIQEPGDPVAYSRYFLLDRDVMKARWEGAEPELEFGTRIMSIVTLGDMTVPVNGGVMLPWTSGFFGGYDEGLPRLRWLRDRYVLEAVESERADVWGAPVLFDPDNLSNGTDGFEVGGVPAPRPPPGEELRLTFMKDGGAYGMRIPAVEPRGAHVFLVPNPALPFDVNRYMVTAIGAYFDSRGTQIRDEMCMHDETCPWLPWK